MTSLRDDIADLLTARVDAAVMKELPMNEELIARIAQPSDTAIERFKKLAAHWKLGESAEIQAYYWFAQGRVFAAAHPEGDRDTEQINAHASTANTFQAAPSQEGVGQGEHGHLPSDSIAPVGLGMQGLLAGGGTDEVEMQKFEFKPESAAPVGSGERQELIGAFMTQSAVPVTMPGAEYLADVVLAASAPAVDYRKALEDEKRLNALVELAGHLQDGSFMTITISADDATRTWHVVAGKQRFYGGSIRAALDALLATQAPKDEP